MVQEYKIQKATHSLSGGGVDKSHNPRVDNEIKYGCSCAQRKGWLQTSVEYSQNDKEQYWKLSQLKE